MVTYVNDLRLSELATGEGSGTWGTTTNTNLELIGEALGYGTEAITTNADTHTTTVADGATDPGRAMYIKYTGTLDSACTITIAPNTMSRVHIIENATSGSQNIIISQGSGANVTIPNGHVKAVYLDGAGSGAAVTEAFTDLSVGGNLLIDGTTPKLTIGDGGAEDTAIVFDGNAQDFYIALDDSADDLVIGLGSTVGTNPIISIDENSDVAIPNGAIAVGQATFSGSSVLADFHGSGSGVGAQLAFANDHNTDKFFVGLEGNTTGDAFLYQQKDADINFYTNNTFRAKLDNGGKLGLGVTPSASWDANIECLQIGEQSVFRSGDTDFTDATIMATNLYQTGGTDKYITTGFGSAYSQQGGTHFWSTAPSGSADGTATSVEIFRANASGGVTVNNDQDSNINFIAKAGSSANALQVDGSSGAVTINEAGADADFRIESDDSTHMFYFDAGGNSINFDDAGQTAVRSTINKNSSGARVVSTGAYNTIVAIKNGNTANTIDRDATMRFQVGGADEGYFSWIHSDGTNANNHGRFEIAGRNGGTRALMATFNSNVETVFNENSLANQDFRVESDSYTHMWFLDSENNFTHWGNNTCNMTTNGWCIGATGAAHSVFSYTSTNEAFIWNNNNSTGATYSIGFRQNNSTVGYISAASSTTSYNTSSDYRLKTNVKDLENAVDRVNALKPRKFTWIKDGKEEEGFIAHEVQEVYPDAVEGEKDAVDEEGNMKIQVMDYGKITPLLAAGLQEAFKEIESLKQQVAELKGE